MTGKGKFEVRALKRKVLLKLYTRSRSINAAYFVVTVFSFPLTTSYSLYSHMCRVSCIPCWPQTHFVAEDGLGL